MASPFCTHPVALQCNAPYSGHPTNFFYKVAINYKRARFQLKLVVASLACWTLQGGMTVNELKLVVASLACWTLQGGMTVNELKFIVVSLACWTLQGGITVNELKFVVASLACWTLQGGMTINEICISRLANL